MSDDRHAAVRGGLDAGNAETLVARRKHEGVCSLIQLDEFGWCAGGQKFEAWTLDAQTLEIGRSGAVADDGDAVWDSTAVELVAEIGQGVDALLAVLDAAGVEQMNGPDCVGRTCWACWWRGGWNVDTVRDALDSVGESVVGVVAAIQTVAMGGIDRHDTREARGVSINQGRVVV